MDIKKWWKQCTCHHHWRMKRWHWFHGVSGMEPRRAEVEMECTVCGKISYVYPKRGSTEEDLLVARYLDRYSGVGTKL